MVNDKAQLALHSERIEADLARLRKEYNTLAKNVTEAQERAALLKKIAARTTEIAGLSNAVAQVAGQKTAIANRVELTGMDEFPRPYVSIECGKDSAKIYAPKQPVKTIRPPIGADDRARFSQAVAFVDGTNVEL